jgi:hypothetical protein
MTADRSAVICRIRLIRVLVAALVLATAAGAQERGGGPENSGETARALDLIREARQALGGEEALRRMQSLSASGRLRRFVKYVTVKGPDKVEEKEKTLTSKVGFDYVAPDKFRKRVSGSTLNGYGYSYVEVVNGGRAWRNPPLPVASSHRDRRVIDVDDVERSFMRQAQGVRQQLTLYSLGWLLQAIPSLPLELSDAGEFRVEDRVARGVLVEGDEGFRVVLLLDRQTRLPLALAISYIEARREPVIVEVASFNRKYVSDTHARARRERAARSTRPQRREMLLRFEDHRPVAGVLLPHRVTTTLDGIVQEELVISEFEANRPPKPKDFEGEPGPKY